MNIYKLTAVPASFEANCLYLIAPTGNPTDLEIYFGKSDGTGARHSLTRTEAQAMIDAAASGGSDFAIVADIAARNALSPTTNMSVYVKDATADTNVGTGGAFYIYELASTTWILTAEQESLNVSQNWSDIVGKPASTPAQIDAAVSNTHTHSNLTELGKIGQAANGAITYNGKELVQLNQTDW